MLGSSARDDKWSLAENRIVSGSERDHFHFLNPIEITSTWVEREVSDPLQEEGREGLGVGSRGEAKSDWAGHEDGDGGEKI